MFRFIKTHARTHARTHAPGHDELHRQARQDAAKYSHGGDQDDCSCSCSCPCCPHGHSTMPTSICSGRRRWRPHNHVIPLYVPIRRHALVPVMCRRHLQLHRRRRVARQRRGRRSCAPRAAFPPGLLPGCVVGVNGLVWIGTFEYSRVE
jgi:hypothetical protein